MSNSGLEGRRAAITGGSRGIGFAIARVLLQRGADVAICARDEAPLREAETLLRTSGRRVAGFVADVVSTEALEHFALDASGALGGIDTLVCNAGIWGPKGRFDDVAWDDWMYTFDVNVHGVARTVRAFLPYLRKQTGARIVILSGGGATKPMPFLAAYSATKSAVVRLGETLAAELATEGIEVNMLAPGAVNTSMLDEILSAGPERVGEKQYADALKQRDTGGTPAERGASCCAYLLSDRAHGISGRLISAVWDPWERLDKYAAELAESDIYTLRRIVPEERGKTWS